MRRIVLIFLLFICGCTIDSAFAQDLKTSVGTNKELDSLRKREEGAQDTIIYSAKYIKFTKLALSKDSIVLIPLDTSTTNIQHYSPILEPRHPTVGLGNMGLAAKSLLYEPVKTIGFDEGYHVLDYYALTPEDIIYYQARSPFTSLYFVSAGQKEQIFRAIHSQNVKKNWNVGLNFNRADSKGFYSRQRGDNLNVALFSWYQSPSKRYNMWASAIWNTMRAYENGSVRADSIYYPNYDKISRDAEAIRLSSARTLYRKSSLFLKQTYYVGRIDSSSKEGSAVLPTNKVSYILEYNKSGYNFTKNAADDSTAIARALVKSDGLQDLTYTNDSTTVTRLKNEFLYSFFLRAKNSSVIKNELKLDAGIRHELYTYQTLGTRSNGTLYEDSKLNFQNVTLLGNLGYRFSSNIDFNLDVQQIFQGRNAGDFLYEAKSNIFLSKTVGRIALSAYLQNKSPQQLYNYYNGNHYSWSLSGLNNTKVANLSFNYINDKLNLDAGAKYYLTSNYLYLAGDGIKNIAPVQESSDISLIRLDVSKRWRLGRFIVENYIAYQKTNNNAVLRTPEVYTFNSVSIDMTLAKVLKMNLGFDVRYNSKYANYSYSPALGQFYIGSNEVFDSKPIMDVFLKANLKRANLFIKYDYINQGWLSNGYYTVNRYPMQDALLKFGVTWNFYD